ncbi:unnamed protein product [Auanema sp. JU1783]|nr:unnamed protein product [Auanema sp. JU1783]
MGAQQSTTEADNDLNTEDQILNKYQKQTLKCSWRHMSKGGESSCGATIMRRFLNKDENLKAVFQTSALISESNSHHDTNKHREDIVQLLHTVISNMDSPSQISEICMKIGRDHHKYKRMGLKIDHWDYFGESITETIREYDGWKKHRESLRAANVLVSFMIDRMRAGFSQSDARTNLTRTKSARDRHTTTGKGGSKKKLERNQSCPIKGDRKKVEDGQNKARRVLPIPPQ